MDLFLNSNLEFFRAKRFRRFREIFSPGKDTAILDLGGTPELWIASGIPSSITIVNVNPDRTHMELPDNITLKIMDGTSLPCFADHSFDIAFSNSVIEHLFTYEKQQKFASEIKRLAKQYWIQTPARTFPIEPHFLAPFIHWLPKHLRKRLLRYTLMD